jgi:hypothetical protein
MRNVSPPARSFTSVVLLSLAMSLGLHLTSAYGMQTPVFPSEAAVEVERLVGLARV